MVLFRCKIIKVFFGLLLCWSGLGCSVAQAQQSSTAIGTASASVIKPLTTQSLRPLRFGMLHPGSEGGSVQINPETNDQIFLGTVYTNKKRFGRAVFRIVGEQGRQYEVFLPEVVDVKRLFDPTGSALKARNFQAYSRNKAEIGNFGLLGANGRDRLYVGGEIFMNPDSMSGFYATEIDVTVAYQ